MATEAQSQGIVLGKRYRVVGGKPGYSVNAGGGIVAGSLVELLQDDDSDLPFFNRLNEDGSVAYNRCCINIVETKLVEVQHATPLKNYIIEVSDVETTVRVGKILSADQLKRIIEVLGE